MNKMILVLLLTGKYLVNNAWVRRIIHLLTTEASSSSFSLPTFWSASVAHESRPRIIGISKRLRNSAAVPNMPPLTKWMSEKYSNKSFWIGVPDNRMRRLAFNPFNAVYVWSILKYYFKSNSKSKNLFIV